MSEALDAKAVEILDKSQAAIATFADKIADMAHQYGPDVANAALELSRIDAASKLVPAILWLIAIALVAKRIPGWIKALFEIDDLFGVMGCVLGGIIGSTLTVGAIVTVIDVWVWVGVFEPKLWLAKRILNL